MEQTTFDEKTQDALSVLFEQFWVLRSEDPAMYQLIRERENRLKRYVSEKFGFDLIVHQHFIKLEKIPVDPKPWMGIQDFADPMDYAIFCCGLAFTERRSVDEQFLLSNIAEEIMEMYPGEFPLDWTNYKQRKSLVRALKKMVELHIIKNVDGDIDMFVANDEQEVLYEVTVYARYFMRSYPDDLFMYQTTREILDTEWKRHEADTRRKRVYRKLMFSPVVHRETEDDPDFAYIRKYRNRMRDDLEEHTPLRLEVFKNAAFLVMEERKQLYTLFPDQKAIMDIALHFARFLRDTMNQYDRNVLGEIKMTSADFIQLITRLKDQYGHGWSKQYRDLTSKRVSEELLQLLKEWELVVVEPDTGMLVIKSALGRVSGHYPTDYVLEEDGK
ncbi:TIGR02678 family protein [Aquibacillus sp. 3ASR75-11]|uniref:TIGR02678 family protein n=1 Tax=Terrihalobacillus insolitus TaxID=2950438 RepID=A0A9X3WST8_9BACI|nr:TIGR02678 family protein [Terrihalobacillus insolitus]MDC3414689.1 TIGR02678 family protein [Terrihalobacillus insolitus]MDC3424198.1 TIGR02678 family protein [Terrihalobacillus insolitus]